MKMGSKPPPPTQKKKKNEKKKKKKKLFSRSAKKVFGRGVKIG